VVLETGSLTAGTADAGWQPIREALAAELDFFVYDRAGLGQSDPAPRPRPLADFAADLGAVLQGSGTPPPYVLVGSSFGGMVVTQYASLYPAEVAGLLLVDAPHPAGNQRTLAALPAEADDEPMALREFRKLLLATDRVPPETDEWEWLDVPTSIMEARTWDLDALPLIVLTAGRDEWEAGFPLDAAERCAEVWLDMQHALAALSSRGQQRTIADSDHLIHERRPEVVLAALRELAGACEH